MVFCRPSEYSFGAAAPGGTGSIERGGVTKASASLTQAGLRKLHLWILSAAWRNIKYPGQFGRWLQNVLDPSLNHAFRLATDATAQALAKTQDRFGA